MTTIVVLSINGAPLRVECDGPARDSILPKNIILTGQGAKLIDFEAIAPLPRHMDLVHMAAFVCKRSPFESWSLILESYWQLCQEELEGWAFEDWQLSACWYLIRELLYFPPPTGLGNYLQGLSQQIKLCLV